MSVTTARSGMEIRIALRRGVMSRLMMSVPSTCMASICSVTIMVPSSAVMAEPTRPATMREERTGPSSFIMVTATIPPT